MATRNYLTQSFNAENAEEVNDALSALASRSIDSVEDLESWIKHRNEIDCALWELYGWIYVKMTQNTEDEAASARYSAFTTDVWSKYLEWSLKLDEQFANSEFAKKLPKDKYSIYSRSILNKRKIECKENIAVLEELANLAKKYDKLTGSMTIEVNGEQLTFAGFLGILENPNWDIRKEAFDKWSNRVAKDVPALHDLFTEMVELRHQMALNAGVKNYTEYAFIEKERFDYSPEDCANFHDSIQHHIIPVLGGLHKELATDLGLPSIQFWDFLATPENETPLKPFENASELLQKSTQALHAVNPRFGELFDRMKSAGNFDLESRKGKANGGYCMSFFESNLPLIFMNESGVQDNVRVLVHEGGHAVHDMLAQHQELVRYRYTPSEIAELAAMTMELLTMEHWDVFYMEPVDLKRAKKHHLKSCLMGLRRVAFIDKFQHWVYQNPQHTIDERTAAFKKINDDFTTPYEDGTGSEDYTEVKWVLTPHIFKYPLYFIEYGFARLGSLAIWRNYKKDPKKTVQQYMNALSLGYTKPIPEVYKAAGIRFDFSAAYVSELAPFVKSEIEALS